MMTYFIDILYRAHEIVIDDTDDTDDEVSYTVGPAKICVGDRFREALEVFDYLVKWNLNRVDYIRLRLGDKVLTRLTPSGEGDW